MDLGKCDHGSMDRYLEYMIGCLRVCDQVSRKMVMDLGVCDEGYMINALGLGLGI